MVIDVNFSSSPQHIEIKGDPRDNDHWLKLLMLLKFRQSFVNKGVGGYAGISIANVKTRSNSVSARRLRENFDCVDQGVVDHRYE